MSTWKNIWVVGQAQAMEAFLEAKKIDDGDGGKVLPHEIWVSNAIYPQEQTGTDENGLPIYAKKAGQQLALWCFSLHGDKQALVEEIRLLSNPNYTILDTKTVDGTDEEGNPIQYEVPYSLADILTAYPDYALGQGIPHIAGVH